MNHICKETSIVVISVGKEHSNRLQSLFSLSLRGRISVLSASHYFLYKKEAVQEVSRVWNLRNVDLAVSNQPIPRYIKI